MKTTKSFNLVSTFWPLSDENVFFFSGGSKIIFFWLLIELWHNLSWKYVNFRYWTEVQIKLWSRCWYIQIFYNVWSTRRIWTILCVSIFNHNYQYSFNHFDNMLEKRIFMFAKHVGIFVCLDTFGRSFI